MELLDHIQMQHVGAVVHVDDAEVGPVRQPCPIAGLSETPAQLGTIAPALDAVGEALRKPPWPAQAAPPAAGPATDPPLADVRLLELGCSRAQAF